MVVYGLYQALTALAISTLSNLTGMRMSLMFDFAAESYGFDETEEIPVEVKTVAFRRVLVNRYCNAWYLLP